MESVNGSIFQVKSNNSPAFSILHNKIHGKILNEVFGVIGQWLKIKVLVRGRVFLDPTCSDLKKLVGLNLISLEEFKIYCSWISLSMNYKLSCHFIPTLPYKVWSKECPVRSATQQHLWAWPPLPNFVLWPPKALWYILPFSSRLNGIP